MRVSTALAAASIATSAVLLLTACGSSDSKSSDKIQGAQSGSPTTTTPTTTATTTVSPAGPDLVLPADLKLSFEWPASSDSDEVAVLAAVSNFIRSIDHSVVKQNSKDSGLFDYSTGKALSYGQYQANAYISHNWTLTGIDRYFQSQVKMNVAKNSAEVSFCNNQGKLFGKEIKTGKVLVTPPSDADYVFFELVMMKSKFSPYQWQATTVTVTEKATRCKR